MTGMSNVTKLAGEPSGQEFLVFTLGDEEYGIDILKVQEIRGYDQVTRIANTPAFIKGVTNLRGVIVPILNLRVKFAQEDVITIAGQKALITKAKKSIAGFRVREEMPLGTKVTLRGDRMYEFLDRLVTIALPRVRDFRGVKGTSFDGRGNYAMGLKEHIVFPEINFDKVDEVLGMDIIICTTANSDAEAKALLKAFNMPFNS